jgi:hypothetical protein
MGDNDELLSELLALGFDLVTAKKVQNLIHGRL